jgi:sRNA-binding carbon storage regulator CsrA
MIYLTLQEDEQLYIGDTVNLSFQRHQDPLLKRCSNPSLAKQIKVAVDAPKTVKILRSELVNV